MRRSILWIGGLILIGGLGFGIVKGPLAPSDSAVSAAPEEQVRFITSQELKERLDRGENLLIADIRRRQAFETLHMQGAVSLPMEQHASWGPTLDKSRTVVLYCT